jgi:hypothetical protein
MSDASQSAALKAARLAAGLPAVASPNTQLRRSKSDRQNNRSTHYQASEVELSVAYLDLQNRYGLKRSNTVTNVHTIRKPGDDASSSTTRSWTPPPPPYPGRARSSTTSSIPALEDFDIIGRTQRALETTTAPDPPRQTRVRSYSGRPAVVQRMASEASSIGTSSTTSSRPTSSYGPVAPPRAPAQYVRSSLASESSEQVFNAAPSRQTPTPTSNYSRPRTYSAAATPSTLSLTESTPAAASPQASLMRRLSSRRFSGSSKNDGTSTPPNRNSMVVLPSTPEPIPIDPPSFPSPDQLASLDRRQSGVFPDVPDRYSSPVPSLTRARSNSAPRAAVMARRYSSFSDYDGNSGVYGSIHEEDESQEHIPPVPALPTNIPNPRPMSSMRSQPRPRAQTADRSRARPESAVMVNSAGFNDWRKKENSTPSFPITSPALAAARLSVVPEQQRELQREQQRQTMQVEQSRLMMPEPPRQIMQIGNDVELSKQSINEMRDRRETLRQPKQTRFVDPEPSRSTTPAEVSRPTTATNIMVIGDDKEAVSEKKSRRKSFMSRSKSEDGEKKEGKCIMM